MNGTPSSNLLMQNRVHKKLQIKQFKVKPQLPDDYFETTWGKLSKAVEAIQCRNTVKDSLEELYRLCENLCHHKKQEVAYERLSALCTEHMVYELHALKSGLNNNNSEILQLVTNCWNNHCSQMVL